MSKNGYTVVQLLKYIKAKLPKYVGQLKSSKNLKKLNY